MFGIEILPQSTSDATRTYDMKMSPNPAKPGSSFNTNALDHHDCSEKELGDPAD
jgi:hypothetical protein